MNQQSQQSQQSLAKAVNSLTQRIARYTALRKNPLTGELVASFKTLAAEMESVLDTKHIDMEGVKYHQSQPVHDFKTVATWFDSGLIATPESAVYRAARGVESISFGKWITIVKPTQLSVPVTMALNAFNCPPDRANLEMIAEALAESQDMGDTRLTRPLSVMYTLLRMVHLIVVESSKNPVLTQLRGKYEKDHWCCYQDMTEDEVWHQLKSNEAHPLEDKVGNSDAAVVSFIEATLGEVGMKAAEIMIFVLGKARSVWLKQMTRKDTRGYLSRKSGVTWGAKNLGEDWLGWIGSTPVGALTTSGETGLRGMRGSLIRLVPRLSMGIDTLDQELLKRRAHFCCSVRMSDVMAGRTDAGWVYLYSQSLRSLRSLRSLIMPGVFLSGIYALESAFAELEVLAALGDASVDARELGEAMARIENVVKGLKRVKSRVNAGIVKALGLAKDKEISRMKTLPRFLGYAGAGTRTRYTQDPEEADAFFEGHLKSWYDLGGHFEPKKKCGSSLVEEIWVERDLRPVVVIVM
ncbi:hypothetical protein BS47DRAFT_1366320 [Hydnum rufescens UP504]|uniref:Uncharacterized protein n=1 Tax=Hydnum rufescens UP504 TaxID=1448309 RepID=A0A9P6DR00_9AGAM|nr:hypothetical protein BS47DRAFT_1366320 [Hydnum rufescens UP504]